MGACFFGDTFVFERRREDKGLRVGEKANRAMDASARARLVGEGVDGDRIEDISSGTVTSGKEEGIERETHRETGRETVTREEQDTELFLETESVNETCRLGEEQNRGYRMC